ncbi:MAG: septum formation family protein [Actinomycetes bacterium]
MLKKLVSGGLAIAAGAAIWGVAGQDHTIRSPTGAIVKSGQLGAFVTKLGDCFASLPSTDSSGLGSVSTVEGIPCTSPHHWQVIFKGALNLGTYDLSQIKLESEDICKSDLNKLANTLQSSMVTEYQSAQTNILFPTSDSWSNGDRSVDCILGSETQTFSDSLI